MYDGIPCFIAANRTDDDFVQCCYNTAKWCPSGSSDNCERYDRGAYPTGDQRMYPDQMTNPLALSPFPNAIVWNWATIFVLAFGNLAALDFQARCMASKTPQIASTACFMAGLMTIVVGFPFSFLGGITRYVSDILFNFVSLLLFI